CRRYNSSLPDWVKFGLLLAAIGLGFGADAVFGFIRSFGAFLFSILFGCAFWFAIFASINWVFDRFERRAGTDAAVLAMFAYVFISLPLVVWVLDILVEWVT